jgi:hypothetical protein
MDVWGRYAPDMTQNGHKLVRFCDVHGCLGSLRSRYDPKWSQIGKVL